MSKALNLEIELPASLDRHVAQRVGKDGDFANVSAYILDLIRQDQQSSSGDFDQLRRTLQEAFDQPDDAAVETDLATIKQRNAAART